MSESICARCRFPKDSHGSDPLCPCYDFLPESAALLTALDRIATALEKQVAQHEAAMTAQTGHFADTAAQSREAMAEFAKLTDLLGKLNGDVEALKQKTKGLPDRPS